MVESQSHSSTVAGLMQAGESNAWSVTLNNLKMHDLWLQNHSNAARYTFHSTSHHRAWSRLDRVYSLQLEWLPAICDMQVQYQMHLSDHSPLVVNLQHYDWESSMSGLINKRPLMVNNLLLSHTLFKSLVYNLVGMLNDSDTSHVQRWMLFISQTLDNWMYLKRLL